MLVSFLQMPIYQTNALFRCLKDTPQIQSPTDLTAHRMKRMQRQSAYLLKNECKLNVLLVGHCVNYINVCHTIFFFAMAGV